MDNRIEGVVITFNEVTQIKAADLRTLQERESHLTAILDAAADAIITIDRRGAITSANGAAARIFGYSHDELIGQNVKLLMPSPYAEEHDGYIANYLATGVKKIIGIGREVEGRRKDGSVFPIDLVVGEVDHLKMFTAIVRDITQRKQLEHEVVEIASLEQQRLGADLHDSCGKELTALGLLASSLVQSLAKNPSGEAALARKIADGTKRVLQHIRNVAHGLSQPEIGPDELSTSLRTLVSRLSETSGVRCVFKEEGRLHVKDSITATHLYHLAQEACTNSLRHAKAKKLQVDLASSQGLMTLTIRDDGSGIPRDTTGGLGMRIMRNRAKLIGASLAIESAKPHGTVVTCTLREGFRHASQ